MPTAIITGASRGLGLALAARARRATGWRLVIDARDAADLEAAARELGRRRESSRSPATSPTPRTARALVAAAGDRDRPARQQRQRARPEPAAGARRLPARRARARLSRQRPRAARARPARAAALPARRARSSTSPPTPPSSPTRAGAATARPRRRSSSSRAILAAEHPELRVYAVDPGDMRTRMHQEAFPGEDISDRPAPEDERARPARADRRASCRAGATARPRARGGCARERRARLRAARRRSRRTSRPRRAGSRATRCGCWSPARRRRARARAVRDLPDVLAPGDLLVVNISATAPRGARRPARRRHAVGCTLATPAPRAAPASWWVVELRTRRRRASAAATARAGERARARRRRAARARRALRAAARGCGWRRLELPRRRCPTTSPATARPIRYGYVARARGRSRPTRPSSPPSPGSAEMPSAGRPFTPRAAHPAGRARVAVAPITLHTGVSSPERHEAPYPERYRSPRPRPGWSTPSAAGAAA